MNATVVAPSVRSGGMAGSTVPVTNMKVSTEAVTPSPSLFAAASSGVSAFGTIPSFAVSVFFFALFEVSFSLTILLSSLLYSFCYISRHRLDRLQPPPMTTRPSRLWKCGERSGRGWGGISGRKRLRKRCHRMRSKRRGTGMKHKWRLAMAIEWLTEEVWTAGGTLICAFSLFRWLQFLFPLSFMCLFSFSFCVECTDKS